MAVTTDQPRLVIEAGNDSKVAFDFQFKIFAKTDLKCWKVSAAGAYTLGTVDIDYTVSFSAADEEGTVTWAVAPVSGGYSVIAGSEMAFTQGTEFPRDTAIPAATHRNVVDRLCILCQQLSDVLFGRALLWDEELYLEDREQIVVSEAPVDRRALIYERNADDDGWDIVPSDNDPDTQVIAAAASATAAAASAVAAAGSAVTAGASATAAGLSAAAAAASAALAATLSLSYAEGTAAAKTTPTTNQIYYSTDTGQLEFYVVTAGRWFPLG